MPETTDSLLPGWWNEIAEDLAQLNIAWVAVTDTGTPKKPAWTAVVVLHIEHFHYMIPAGKPRLYETCGAFPWAFAARDTEADAWKAAEVFLRGVAAVRNGTKERAPWSAQEKTAAALKRRTGHVCSAVDTWHDRLHGLSPTDDPEGASA